MLLTLVATLFATSHATNSTIYIIRHGEKTFGGGCLNIQGQERANHMHSVFDGKLFARPAAIFANKYFDQTNCERCWLTVQSIAQTLSLPVHFDNGYPKALGGNAGAAAAIKNVSKTAGVVLVSWEHYNIQFLAENLGVPKADLPTWKGTDYDSVYVLELDAAGKLTSFEAKAQGYKPKSTTCPPHYVPPPGEAYPEVEGEGYPEVEVVDA